MGPKALLGRLGLRWVWSNGYMRFSGGCVGGEGIAEGSFGKGNGVATMELRLQWLLSCDVGRCWESGEEF